MRRLRAYVRNFGGALLALVMVGGVLGWGLLQSHGASRWTSLAAWMARQAARATLDLSVGVAEAQQALEFKPVPAESAARFDRMRVVRRERATAVRESLSRESGGSIPEPPDTPEPPDVPDTPHGRTGSIMRIGSDIHVEKNEVIEGDISSVNGDIVVEGRVQGDVMAMRGDVDLKSTAHVDGDVVCIGGTLSEEPGARVDGQRVTAPGASNWREFARHQRGEDDEPRGERVTGALVWLLLLLLFAWIFAHFAPGRTNSATQTVILQPGMSIGIGSLVWALLIPSLIALVLVVALLCITIIGIPLALAALVGYFVFLALLWMWGLVVGGVVLGGALSRRAQSANVGTDPRPEPTLLRRAMIGSLVLSGAFLVGRLLHTSTGSGPIHALGTLLIVLAWIAMFLSATVGAGALLRTEFSEGTLGRWWAGRKRGTTTASAAAAASSSTGMPPPVDLGPSPSVASGTDFPPSPPVG